MLKEILHRLDNETVRVELFCSLDDYGNFLDELDGKYPSFLRSIHHVGRVTNVSVSTGFAALFISLYCVTQYRQQEHECFNAWMIRTFGSLDVFSELSIAWLTEDSFAEKVPESKSRVDSEYPGLALFFEGFEKKEVGSRDGAYFALALAFDTERGIQ